MAGIGLLWSCCLLGIAGGAFGWELHLCFIVIVAWALLWLWAVVCVSNMGFLYGNVEIGAIGVSIAVC